MKDELRVEAGFFSETLTGEIFRNAVKFQCGLNDSAQVALNNERLIKHAVAMCLFKSSQFVPCLTQGPQL